MTLATKSFTTTLICAVAALLMASLSLGAATLALTGTPTVQTA